jgi:hypothetical protein
METQDQTEIQVKDILVHRVRLVILDQQVLTVVQLLYLIQHHRAQLKEIYGMILLMAGPIFTTMLLG